MIQREDLKKIRKKLKDCLSKSRYQHTLGVEFTAAAMAMKYSIDIDMAELAGLLHDCAKCIDDEEKLEECKKYNVKITDVEKRNPFLIHSKLGAVYAREKYGVDDEEILSAIRCHTTGKPDMTTLEKIIFIADYIEPGRDKEKNLAEIRKISFEDIDEAMYMILRDTLEYLEGGEGEIDPTTEETYLFYKKLHDEKSRIV
ncbi:MAG: bis(5'-nucleosyl)-tetraphosphatase (symmetrical) YqeK [Lachnospiraceae bacterium]|nr:bis(5'-nucleosyl)-tetraphosphatase (symmetrical) YqeK [Lachnospiraceae bacterium]